MNLQLFKENLKSKIDHFRQLESHYKESSAKHLAANNGKASVFNMICSFYEGEGAKALEQVMADLVELEQTQAT